MTGPSDTLADTTGRTWRIGTTTHVLGGGVPWLMGILNVTPDSFSDGGEWVTVESAVERAREMVAAGASMIDVGGESTRPGADPVDSAVELQRVVNVVEAVVKAVDVPVSIDTMKSVVARAAVEVGASVVNDVSGLEADDLMVATCVELDVAVVCMHMRGTPATMQDDPVYADVVEEVASYLESRLERLVSAGMSKDRVVLDPGIGFGKTASDNLQLLGSIDRLHRADRPLLVGHSRKRFLAQLLGRPIEERLSGTIGVAVALAGQGVEIMRVHDVAAVQDALLAWRKVTDAV